jgi:hypothetical protein
MNIQNRNATADDSGARQTSSLRNEPAVDTQSLTGPQADALRKFLLSQLRCELLRLKLMVNEITFVGVALSGGMITTDEAFEELHVLGVLDHIGARDEGATA